MMIPSDRACHHELLILLLDLAECFNSVMHSYDTLALNGSNLCFVETHCLALRNMDHREYGRFVAEAAH